jgi:hypothetical protein
MSDFNPSAATGSQPQSPDIQHVVRLLGSLMPLLLRFHTQVLEQPIQAMPGQAMQGNAAVPNPAFDRQAAENLAGDITSESLRTLSAYLEDNAGRYPGLEGCVAIVTQAARRFAARDYAQAFNQIWLAYRTIETIRAADPRIPPMRSAGRAPSDQTSSSIH